MVTQHDVEAVGRIAGGDGVSPGATQDQVAAAAHRDGVACTFAAGVGFDPAQAVGEAVHLERAHVAQHHIAAVAQGDVIAAVATDDDMVAIQADDLVVIAVKVAPVHIDRAGLDASLAVELQAGKVAHHHVAAATRVQSVCTHRAQQHIVAVTADQHLAARHIAHGEVLHRGASPPPFARGQLSPGRVVGRDLAHFLVVVGQLDGIGRQQVAAAHADERVVAFHAQQQVLTLGIADQHVAATSPEQVVEAPDGDVGGVGVDAAGHRHGQVARHRAEALGQGDLAATGVDAHAGVVVGEVQRVAHAGALDAAVQAHARGRAAVQAAGDGRRVLEHEHIAVRAADQVLDAAEEHRAVAVARGRCVLVVDATGAGARQHAIVQSDIVGVVQLLARVLLQALFQGDQGLADVRHVDMQAVGLERHVQGVLAAAARDQGHLGGAAPGGALCALGHLAVQGVEHQVGGLVREVQHIAIAARVAVVDAGLTPVAHEAVAVSPGAAFQRGGAAARHQQVAPGTAAQRGFGGATNQHIAAHAAHQGVFTAARHQHHVDRAQARCVDGVLALTCEADDALDARIHHGVVGAVERGRDLDFTVAQLLQHELLVAVVGVLVLAVARTLVDEGGHVEVHRRVGGQQGLVAHVQHKGAVAVVVRGQDGHAGLGLPHHLEELELEQGLLVDALPAEQEGVQVDIDAGVQAGAQAGFHQVQRIERRAHQLVEDLGRTELAIAGARAFFIPEVQRAIEPDAAGRASAQDHGVQLGVELHEHIQRDLGEVHTIADVVADVEAIEDVQRVAAVDEAHDPGRVEAQGQCHVQVDATAHAGHHRGPAVHHGANVDAGRHAQVGWREGDQIHRLAHDQVQRQLEIGQQRDLEGVVRVLELVQEAGRASGAATGGARLGVGHRGLLQGRARILVDRAIQRGVLAAVGVAQVATEAEHTADRDDQAGGIGGDGVEQVQHVDEAADELRVHLALAHRLGQVEDRVIATGQLRQTGDWGHQPVDHGLQRLGDLLDLADDGREEVGEEAANVDAQVGDPHLRRGGEGVAVARGDGVGVERPGEVEVGHQAWQHLDVGDRQIQAEVGLCGTRDRALEVVGELAPGHLAPGQAAIVVGVHHVDGELAPEEGPGADVTAEGVVVLDQVAALVDDAVAPVVGELALQEEDLGRDFGRIAPGARGQEGLELDAQLLDGGTDAGLGQHPGVGDHGVQGRVLGVLHPADGLARVVGIVQARVPRHLGHQVQAVLRVHAEAEVEIPAQVQRDAAVHGQVQTRQADVERQIDIPLDQVLAQVHAQLQRAGLAEGVVAAHVDHLPAELAGAALLIRAAACQRVAQARAVGDPGHAQGQELDHDVVCRDQVVGVVVLQEVQQRVVARAICGGGVVDLPFDPLIPAHRVDEAVVVRVLREGIEQHHAQGVLHAAELGQRVADEILDLGDHAATEVGDELGPLGQLTADQGQRQVGDGVQRFLDALERVVDAVDDDGRIPDQADERVAQGHQIEHALEVGQGVVHRRGRARTQFAQGRGGGGAPGHQVGEQVAQAGDLQLERADADGVAEVAGQHAGLLAQAHDFVGQGDEARQRDVGGAVKDHVQIAHQGAERTGLQVGGVGAHHHGLAGQVGAPERDAPATMIAVVHHGDAAVAAAHGLVQARLQCGGVRVMGQARDGLGRAVVGEAQVEGAAGARHHRDPAHVDRAGGVADDYRHHGHGAHVRQAAGVGVQQVDGPCGQAAGKLQQPTVLGPIGVISGADDLGACNRFGA